MKNQITIITRPIEGGKTGMSNEINAAIAKLEGKKAKITIEEWVKPRSDKQNRYYFGVVVPIIQAICERGSDEIWSVDRTHEFIKREIWEMTEVKTYYRRDPQTLELVPYKEIEASKSRTLNAKQWEDMMTKTRAWAAEIGVDIPEPIEKIPDYLDEPTGVYYDYRG